MGYEDRKLLEYTCQSGFLFSVVVVQKPLNNHVLNFALIFETVLAFLIIYIPGNSEGLQLAPMSSPIWWLPGLAFSIVLVSYEELRKAIARKHKGCWVDK